MALGTIASRATGFLRTVAIAAAIGTASVGDAYNLANTIPNIVYDLLIGGILTSVVVPVLVRAAKEDPDGGERFASSLLTLMILLLGGACLLGVLLAPQIVDQYMHGVSGPKGPAEHALGATFLRWFMPQIVFYGVGATIGAILNVRGSFSAPMFTPVLNNLAMIITCAAFTYVIAGPHAPDVTGAKAITSTQTAVLAGGTTLGVVLMTIALLPSLRKVGFRYRPRLDLNHPELRKALRLAGWTILWVVVSQAGYVVISNLASAATQYSIYTYGYQLFQLPYAIIGVSVITALLPRMSAHAADGDRQLVLEDLSTATRLSMTAIVPAALFLLALGRPIAVGVFNHYAVGYHSAIAIGDALSAFAVALVPFSVFQLHLRVFYAHQDSRTPALVNIGVVAMNITAALALSHLLPASHRAMALALAFTVGYLIGLCVTCALLRRRLGGMDGDRIIATLARISVAAGIGAAAASAVAHGLLDVLGNGFLGSFTAVLAAAIIGLPLFVGTVTRMGIPEVRALTRMVSRRFRRG
jgi:putative peptidoglycan lipid II flippase